MDIDRVFRYLKRDLQKVEKALVTHLKSPVPLVPVVGRHIILSGGKRFRPAVLLLVAHGCGYTGPRRIVMAVVTEYMHNATLLHDDVVDGGVIRRGRPAANVVYGNTASVLVGDFLFARASQLMTDDGDPKVLAIYARTLVSLSEGEVLQLTRSADPAISEKEYLDVVFHKTASLIAAASETGAVLGGASALLRRRMYDFGKAMGNAFQLADDVLDYTGTEEELGKRPLQDLREGKITLPLIFALRAAPHADRARACKILARGTLTEREIAFVARLVERNGGLDYTKRRARDFVEAGKRFLFRLPPSTARDCLAALSDYIVSRTS